MAILAIQNEILASDMVKMARSHCEFVIYESFMKGLQEGLGKGEIDIKAEKHLVGLLKVYGLKLLSDQMTPLLCTKYFNRAHVDMVEHALLAEIKALRPMLLSLVEVFDIPDEVLLSAIGSKSLDPYETVLKWARNHNSLNKHHVLPGFNEYVRPLMKAKL